MEFRSRAVRSLVELHEREIRAFLETWSRFVASGLPMPEAHGDEHYESSERLVAHVLMAARGYLIRMGEWVDRPVVDIDASTDPHDVFRRLPAFAEDVLSAYRRHMAVVTNEELEPQSHHTRWGGIMSVEDLFEHGVVHPMRHRLQLERILEGR